MASLMAVIRFFLLLNSVIRNTLFNRVINLIVHFIIQHTYVMDMKCVSNPLYFCLNFVYEGAGLPTVELSDVDMKIQDLISATVLEGIAGGVDTSRFAYKHIIGPSHPPMGYPMEIETFVFLFLALLKCVSRANVRRPSVKRDFSETIKRINAR